MSDINTQVQEENSLGIFFVEDITYEIGKNSALVAHFPRLGFT
jgi:hypothetical protein